MTAPTAETMAEVAAAILATIEGISTSPDTTADPLQLAYLRGVADGIIATLGDRSEGLTEGRDQRDTGQET